MNVIHLRNIALTDREVHCPNGGFVSYRFLLKKDGMGFGLHKTVIPAGLQQRWHYKHHKEACYCIAGRGILVSADTGESFEIVPDTCYVLDKHDEHFFTALEDTVLISVFNPAVVGSEVHGKDGSYSIGEQDE
jgi:L-ectoine synthase